MTFSADVWSRNAALYDAIRDMPFNRSLAAGTLHRDAFRHYIVQDAHYLTTFAQALAVAAAKSDQAEDIARFAQSALEAVAVERVLHTDYFRLFGLSAEAVAGVPMSPTCHHYASFLVATAFREPLPVLVAAMLPCFWIYREVGVHVATTAAGDNPYRAWIDTYGGEDFSAVVDRMIATADLMAGDASPVVIRRMGQVFTRAAQLEWMFWNAASVRETWPV